MAHSTSIQRLNSAALPDRSQGFRSVRAGADRSGALSIRPTGCGGGRFNANSGPPMRSGRYSSCRCDRRERRGFTSCLVEWPRTSIVRKDGHLARWRHFTASRSDMQLFFRFFRPEWGSARIRLARCATSAPPLMHPCSRPLLVAKPRQPRSASHPCLCGPPVRGHPPGALVMTPPAIALPSCHTTRTVATPVRPCAPMVHFIDPRPPVT